MTAENTGELHYERHRTTLSRQWATGSPTSSHVGVCNLHRHAVLLSCLWQHKTLAHCSDNFTKGCM